MEHGIIAERLIDGDIRYSVNIMVDGTRSGPSPAPLLGQHNQEVFCGELGLSTSDLSALAGEGVI